MKTTALIFRIIGLILFATAGFYVGDLIVGMIDSNLNSLPYAIGGAAVLAAIGFLITPYITLYPVIRIRSYLTKVSGPTLFSAMIGLVIGLIIAALATIPIMTLPDPFRSILPFAAAVLFGYLGVAIAVNREGEFRDIFSVFRRGPKSAKENQRKWERDKSILIDTSVIIDGRFLRYRQYGHQ